MAVPASLTEQLDSLYSSTWQGMRDEAVDNIFKATPLTYWLYNGDRVRREEGSRWIGIQLMYGKNTTVKTIGPGGTVGMTYPEHTTTAQFTWRFLAGSVIRLFSEDTWNRGKNAIYNKVKNDLKNLELSIIDQMETLLATGDGTTNGGLDFDGLANLVAQVFSSGAGQTVGGIDSNAQTWWQNFVRAYSTTGMITGDKGALFNLRKAYNTISIGNDHPTLILSDQGSFEAYEAAVTGLLLLNKTLLADAGFDSLAYKGSAMTYSPSIPAQTVYLLNERYIELVINSAADFVMTPWKPIPNQLDRVAQVVVEGDLVVSNRRMNGVITGFTGS